MRLKDARIYTPFPELSWSQNLLQARMMGYTHVKFRYIRFDASHKFGDFLMPLASHRGFELLVFGVLSEKWFRAYYGSGKSSRRGCRICWGPIDPSRVSKRIFLCLRCKEEYS